MFKHQVGYVLRYTRVLPPSGEQFEVTTNLSLKASKEDFADAFDKMSYAAQKRMEWINEQVEEGKAKENPDTPLNREQRRELKHKGA